MPTHLRGRIDDRVIARQVESFVNGNRNDFCIWLNSRPREVIGAILLLCLDELIAQTGESYAEASTNLYRALEART